MGVLFALVYLILLSIGVRYFASAAKAAAAAEDAAAAAPCVKYGKTFDVPLEGSNVVLDCKMPLSGKPICCAAVVGGSSHNNNSRLQQRLRGIGESYEDSLEVLERLHTQVRLDYSTLLTRM